MSDPDLHVSDLRWDRLLAGELAAPDAAIARAHAAACDACDARLAALTAEHAAFAQLPTFAVATDSPAAVASTIAPTHAPPRRAPRRRAPWLTAGAAFAVGLIGLLVIRARPTDDDPGARTKGGAANLVLVAGPEGRLVPVTTGDQIHPGDSLQAAYTSTRDGYGAVLSRDGTGAALSYVPSSGDAMVALPAGALQSFPESTVLDRVIGDEAVVVVWCATRHPIAPLLAELAAHGSVEPPADCAIRRVVLDKRAEPR